MQHASVIYLAEIGLECPREKYSLERQYKQQYKHHSTSSKEDFFDTHGPLSKKDDVTIFDYHVTVFKKKPKFSYEFSRQKYHLFKLFYMFECSLMKITKIVHIDF